MASLKKGDKVKSIVEIKNGILTATVKEGAKGTVLEDESRGQVRVHFDSAGIGWPAVDCTVKTDYVVKIRSW